MLIQSASVIVCLFLTRVVAETVAAPCNLGWKQFGDVCVAISKESLTWLEALSVCHAYGGRLLEIESPQKNDWIVDQLKELNVGGAWIGGTERYSQVWEWIPSFKEIKGYENWGHGKPDRRGDEQCLHLWGPIDYKWNDAHCWALYVFICEKRVTK